jgi:hypothetical protein
MDINTNFDLLKFRNLLLTENYESSNLKEEEVERLGIYDDIDNEIMNGGFSDEENIEYLNSIIDYCNKEIQSIQLYNPDDLEENASLEEMAKLTGKEGVLTPLGQKAAEIIKNNPELEKGALLNTLKSDPEIAQILNDTEEELYQNQTNQFASLVRGSREIGQRGRKADPNKPAVEPKVKTEKPTKEKSPKLKITDPTAGEKPVSSTFIDGGDEEDMADEMAAIKAAKGGKRLGDATTQLAQVTKEMKALIPAYQAAKGTAKEAAIVAQLRGLTAEKKALEAKVDKMFKGPKMQTADDLIDNGDVNL